MKKKILMVLAVILVGYLILQFIPTSASKESFIFNRADGEQPLVIAHGGGKLLNPENTWMAFDYAADLGVDVLEIDLRMTKDHQLITHHNKTIDSTSNMTGAVYDYTYDEITKMNFGHNFIDLDNKKPYNNLNDKQIQEYNGALSPVRINDLFAKYGDGLSYIVEIKDEGDLGKKAADLLVSYVIEYHLEEYVCLASFDQEIMDYMLSIKPENVVVSFDFDTALEFVIAAFVGYDFFLDYPHYGFQLPVEEYNIPLTNGYLVNKIKRHDFFVHYWTVNEVDEMLKCINANADGIITDRPDLLFELLDK